MKIILPERFELQVVGPITQEFEINWQFDDTLIIDFSEVSYSFPFSTLAIGAALRQLVTKRKNKGLVTLATGIKKCSAQSYLSHVGFFNYIGLPHGKSVGEASGSHTYTAITSLDLQSLLNQVSSPYRELRHVILEKSENLAKLFSHKSTNNNSILALSYMLREIIRNIFEHSQSQSCYLFGQRWPDGSVEISIIDEGVGVKNTLSKTYDIKTDSEALDLAIQPGITRIKDIDVGNVHDNSGFGLYTLSRLGNDYGWFTIASGTTLLSLENNEEYRYNTCVNGTYVGIHLKSEPENFENVLNTIIHDGEVEAHEMGRCASASSSSRLFF